MTTRMIPIAMFASVALCGVLQAQQQQPRQPPPVGDLASVVNVMKDPAATAAKRDVLVGKVYAGVITVDAIRLEPPDQSVAIVLGMLGGPGATEQATSMVALRFTARTDDEKVQQLRRGQSVKVRATLKDFTLGTRTNFANFTDLVIEGPGR